MASATPRLTAGWGFRFPVGVQVVDPFRVAQGHIVPFFVANGGTKLEII